LWSSCRLAKQKYTLKAYVKSFLELRANITAVSTISAAIGFGTIVYVNTVAKPWFLTNLQGFAVSYSALQLMSPTTFATGSLVLGALFCYDIWAVFFTPLMVTVAKNLDQPIKMVFPRPDEPSATPGEPPVKSFSMLGLGDIVLPGIMIGLALRFDLYMYYMKKQTKAQKVVAGSDGDKTAQEVMEKAPYISPTGRWGDRFWTYTLPVESLPSQLRSSFPKRYFAASMIGYVVGMLMTLGVMSVFQHAQPALLYLVPGVLISLWGTAVVRGEFKEMWNFTEALNGEQLEESKESEGSNQAKAGQKHLGLFERLWQELWSNSDQAKDKLKSKTKPEEGDGEGQQKSISIEQEGTKQEKDNSEGAEARDEGLIFALSLTRFEANTKASVKDPSTTASAVPEKMDDGDT
jgi:minor histocompatibility antigen H13